MTGPSLESVKRYVGVRRAEGQMLVLPREKRPERSETLAQ